MRTKKDVSTDIEKFRVSQDKLKAELGQLVEREKATLETATDDILAGREALYNQSLADLRSRKELVTAAVDTAGRKLRELDAELEELKLSERVQVWSTLEKSLWMELGKLQGMIGDIRAELTTAEGLVYAGEQSGAGEHLSQDFSIVFARFRVIRKNLDNELVQIQNQIAELLASKSNGKK
jgi:hypothetical protein